MPKYKNFEDLSRRQQRRRIKKMMELNLMGNDVQTERANVNENWSENVEALIVKIDPSEESLAHSETLLSQLNTWATENCESQSSMQSLFQILRDAGHADLPENGNVESSTDDPVGDERSWRTRENQFPDSPENEPLGTFVDCSSGHTTCCQSCRLEFEVINRKLDHIIGYMKVLNNANKPLYPKIHSVSSAANVPSLLPLLPLKTVEDVKNFDAYLHLNTEMQNEFMYKIIKVGGESEKKHIRNVLTTCFSNDLAYTLSWTGQKSSPAIKDTLIASMIIEAILKVHSSANVAQVQARIQDWFSSSIRVS